mmetsp:Transcript_41559/g.81976  ORF Transcript_41559/g.81976 Transcript_41559/m.81976 type:complete len:88 (-) Transcript_41559:1077-1340(-)
MNPHRPSAVVWFDFALPSVCVFCRLSAFSITSSYPTHFLSLSLSLSPSHQSIVRACPSSLPPLRSDWQALSLFDRFFHGGRCAWSFE